MALNLTYQVLNNFGYSGRMSEIKYTYINKKPHKLETYEVEYGAGTRIRTVDLLITSQLLYQLSYAGVV